MRLLSRVLALLVICLTAIALPSAPAQAQICDGPFIELVPSSGAPGTEVTVVGDRFVAGKYIDIYYDGTGEDDIVASGRTTIGGGFAIAFIIPEGYKGGYRVRAKVGANVGCDIVDAYFTVKPGLTLIPEIGPVGTTVTVQGQGFAENEGGIELKYYLDDSYETVESNIIADARGSWETSFQIPPSIRGEHKLDAEGNDSRLYEVVDATFRVTAEISIDESSGKVGDTITMTVNRFAANERGIKILFDGEAVVTDIRADAQGGWEASFEVPELPTGEYSITAEGEQTKQEDIEELVFEIKPGILLSPDEGHVDMDLTVVGSGFAANEDVVIRYDGSQVATAATNDKGSFDVNFSVPQSKYGEHHVTAAYSADNAAGTIFTMESDPPPIPELISPPNMGSVGFRGSIAPTFEWSEVSDDSGVHYRLQIATSANFNASSLIVSVTDLTETSYTLEEADALSYGTYYWIVQAVDGADNESDWTAAHSFRVGLLPLWGLIAAIAAGVVLLILIIRALVRRRSIYYDGW
ncbi:MAG: hypothetical protein JSW38_05535 [Dehalococcoidia bacterium]|nr:MAG: hypothetical protein JSW38_05535 [Dehalococcoidia bacterium]